MNSKFEFVGCYKDMVGKPAFSSKPFETKQVTVAECLAEAEKKKAVFAGLEGAELDSKRNTGICNLSEKGTFTNYGLSKECEKLSDGTYIGKGSNLAVYEMIANDVSEYKPINLKRFKETPIPISTKNMWAFGIKLVSDGTNVSFDTKGSIDSWMAKQPKNSTSSTEIEILSSHGKVLFDNNGKFILRNASSGGTIFTYDESTGTLTSKGSVLRNFTSMPAPLVPPERKLELSKVKADPDQFEWVVPGTPSGNPPAPPPPGPGVPLLNHNGWSGVWIFVGVFILFILVIVIIFFVNRSAQPKPSEHAKAEHHRTVHHSAAHHSTAHHPTIHHSSTHAQNQLPQVTIHKGQ